MSLLDLTRNSGSAYQVETAACCSLLTRYFLQIASEARSARLSPYQFKFQSFDLDDFLCNLSHFLHLNWETVIYLCGYSAKNVSTSLGGSSNLLDELLRCWCFGHEDGGGLSKERKATFHGKSRRWNR